MILCIREFKGICTAVTSSGSCLLSRDQKCRTLSNTEIRDATQDTRSFLKLSYSFVHNLVTPKSCLILLKGSANLIFVGSQLKTCKA